MIPPEDHKRRGVSPFSTLLVTAALSLAGLLCLGRLHVQYTPSSAGNSMTVSFSYPDASPEVVEAEVTSPLEGALSTLRGITEISSSSAPGSGNISLTFRKKTNMAAARFEVASQIRNLYASLPERVSYPSISLNAGGRASGTALAFLLKGAMPSAEIEQYARDRLVYPLSSLAGVDGVNLSGATPFEWVITFDAQKVRSAGITASQIASAFRAYHASAVLGMADDGDGLVTVRLRNAVSDDFGGIPIRTSAGQVVHLGDIATWRYQESLPASYFRVNGLNTITLSVSIVEEANLLQVAGAVKERMRELSAAFPDGITYSLSYDSSQYVSGELHKIYLRTLLCLLILLVFVFLINRSWRYMLAIAATLAVNLSMALAVYYALGLSIHIYTLAGITVSLGIIIDTSIVMIDHYAHWGDRRCFPSLVAAVATTVAALLLVLLLPQEDRANLTDFIAVIAVNLLLSLLVSWFFIPALMHYLPVRPSAYSRSLPRRRRVARFNRLYTRYIRWRLRRRGLYLAVFVLAFGLPLFLIPAAPASLPEEASSWERAWFKVRSWKPYAQNKSRIDALAGSSSGLFHRSLGRANFYRQPARKTLSINAGMLEGCTVAQLNDVVKAMENYLSQFDGIESFVTSITAYNRGNITVSFKPEYERTGFALELKSMVTAMAINFGGANWSVYGIDDNGFNNNIVTGYKTGRISLYGYNYQELYRYAGVLVSHLAANPRVKEPEIWSPGYGGRPAMEFNMSYDYPAMLSAGVDPYAYYGTLYTQLFDSPVGTVFGDGTSSRVILRSSERESYDLWHVLHAPVDVGAGKVTLSQVGNIVKERTGNTIQRHNQSYQVDVCFDFIGSYQLSAKMQEEALQYMRTEVLPVGYSIKGGFGMWSPEKQSHYIWLILLIIAAIFVILAAYFESFRYPLAVIFMIPISFIGLFLVFGLSDFAFDQGGFAAFVMLAGIVVNAGIYLLGTYQAFREGRAVRQPVRCYLRAFHDKIHPIFLTVISTVLGLLPFLSDGPEEVFWFDFAVGTIGGLAFSLIALFLYLPVFALPSSSGPSVTSAEKTPAGRDSA